MIWIRADANKEIGSGHVMRCLSVATALRKMGESVCFVVADENPVGLIQSKGFDCKVLHSDYTDLERESDSFRKAIEAEKPAFLLVDSYFATAEYLRALQKSVPVGYLDDLGRKNLPVDLLINYNIYADRELYGICLEKYGQSGEARYCLGTAYAPLREEFEAVEYAVRRQAKKVLVTTGGGDKYNIADMFLEQALRNPATAELEYIVVSGALNEHIDKLRALEVAHPNIKIYCNVSRMSELMRECDMAFTAGGSTVYELSAVGVPLICFSFADNQRRLVETFYQKGLTCFGGDYLVAGEDMLIEAVQHIGALASDYELRKNYSEKLRRVADGCGAARIAEALKVSG